MKANRWRFKFRRVRLSAQSRYEPWSLHTLVSLSRLRSANVWRFCGPFNECGCIILELFRSTSHVYSFRRPIVHGLERLRLPSLVRAHGASTKSFLSIVRFFTSLTLISVGEEEGQGAEDDRDREQYLQSLSQDLTLIYLYVRRGTHSRDER